MEAARVVAHAPPAATLQVQRNVAESDQPVARLRSCSASCGLFLQRFVLRRRLAGPVLCRACEAPQARVPGLGIVEAGRTSGMRPAVAVGSARDGVHSPQRAGLEDKGLHTAFTDHGFDRAQLRSAPSLIHISEAWIASWY